MQYIDLNDRDIEAILYALPLLTEIDADTDMQNLINANYCRSAINKLNNSSYSFNLNEVRVMSAAISAAMLIISGNDDKMFSMVTSERNSNLHKYFFEFNRLDPIFQEVLPEI